MRALTVVQPWAHAIIWGTPVGPKPVENRTWRPPAVVLGRRIAIHAGKKLDEDTCSEVGLAPSDLDFGAIIGTALCVGWLEERGKIGHAEHGFELLATQALHSQFYWDGIAWLLTECQPIEPIPYRGALGLWRVPSAVVARFREVDCG